MFLMEFQPSLSALLLMLTAPPNMLLVCLHSWLLCLTRCFPPLNPKSTSSMTEDSPSKESGLRVVTCFSLSLPSWWQWAYCLLSVVYLHTCMLPYKQIRGFGVIAPTVSHIFVLFWANFCGPEMSWVYRHDLHKAKTQNKRMGFVNSWKWWSS